MTRFQAETPISVYFSLSVFDTTQKNTRQYRRIEGVCVCTECRQSRLAAAQLAAESPLLDRLAGCIAGWLSCVATTTATTIGITMKFMAYNWNHYEIYGVQLESQ